MLLQVQQAETGWRELLCEKRAKLRGRVTEADIRHAAARMIQVGLVAAAAAAAAVLVTLNSCMLDDVSPGDVDCQHNDMRCVTCISKRLNHLYTKL
jgi:hypothetical protein